MSFTLSERFYIEILGYPTINKNGELIEDWSMVVFWDITTNRHRVVKKISMN